MRTPAKAVLAMAVLALTAAGCGDDGPATEPPPDATPSPTAAAPAGQVAQCVTGTWRTTAVRGADDGDAANWEISGGSGVSVTVDAGGAVEVDFSGMQPVDFAGRVADVDVAGRFSYGGQASGTIGTEGDTSGSWEPEGQVDWAGLRLTVDLTEPVEARPLDDEPVGDSIANLAEQTGDAVDINPFLGTGSYRCEGDTLVLSQDDGRDTEWTLQRQ
jgi:predicted small lipoprotein YifL